MAYFRLYMIGGADGRFVGFEELEAADDVEATRLAERFAGAQAMELWCGKRKVRAYPPLAAAADAPSGAPSAAT